ncbi:MAG: hypothetical protein WCI62_03840, partial [Erysipelotrichaceae bacterium]
SLPVFTLPFIIKMIIKRSKEQGAQSFYHQNKQTIKKGLKLLVKELRKMEPMELISIESKDAVVNIRLK